MMRERGNGGEESGDVNSMHDAAASSPATSRPLLRPAAINPVVRKGAVKGQKGKQVREAARLIPLGTAIKGSRIFIWDPCWAPH